MWKLTNGLYSELELKKYGVLNFTTTSLCGDMKNKKNRQKFLKKYFNIENVIFGNQTHSDNIKIVTEKDMDRKFYSTDGFITNRKNVPIVVFTADCLPVFIFDKIKKIIGLVHAGRAGLSKLVVSKAIDMFVKNFGSNSLDIYAAIGPHICKKCYNVNLDAIAEEQLKKTGVSNISNSKLCTYTGDFFSYRKTKTSKRIISLMMMEQIHT
ncbi:MAG: polyphenol oxidase family protein [Elusimicrobiota bacterium]|nr:polyphenol oxidase family protein [Elusimicrobiota bacterium]